MLSSVTQLIASQASQQEAMHGFVKSSIAAALHCLSESHIKASASNISAARRILEAFEVPAPTASAKAIS